MSSHNTTLVGWQDPPNQRGTFDILKICSITTFLLCWSSVCPNVPSATRGYWGKIASKLQLFLLSLLGPEWVLVIAGGQLNAAYRAKKEFKARGHADWSLRHAFFVNMGGLHVQFEDRKAAGKPTFPIDCQQLLILVEREYVDMPEITKEDIEDRNKSDSLVRMIAVIQSLWFTADSLGRFAQGLSVSTLELTTLAFVFIMTACSVCWWRKPMDITRPVTVPARVPLSTILQETNASTPIRGRLPLSYLTRREWFMSQFWSHYMNLLRKLKLLFVDLPPPGEAAYVASVDFPELDIKWEIVFAPLVALYSAIFLVAWNFQFPTHTEKTLWRISSAYTLAYGILADIVAGSYHQSKMVDRWWIAILKFFSFGRYTPKPTLQADLDRKLDGKKKGIWHRMRAWWYRLRNLSPDQDPELMISLRWSVPATILNFIYVVSRLYVLAEDFAELRSLPASSYRTVNYGPYSPIL